MRSALRLLFLALGVLPCGSARAASAVRNSYVQAQVQVAGPQLHAPLALSVPFRVEGLEAGAVPTLKPLPLTLREEQGPALWMGENVQIGLALPDAVAAEEAVPAAELRNPEHGAFQAEVFSQVQEGLKRRGASPERLRFTSQSMGAAQGRRECPTCHALSLRFKPPAGGTPPDPDIPGKLDEIFEGRVQRRGALLSRLGMDDHVPLLDESSRRLVKVGGIMEDRGVHPEIKAWILTTSALAAVAGAKPATRLFRRQPGAPPGQEPYLATEAGAAELADVVSRVSPDLGVMEAGPELIVFDVPALMRTMLDERADPGLKLWSGDTTPARRDEAYRQQVERILRNPLASGLRAEEGLLLGFPLTAVMDFARRASRNGVPHMIQVAGDYGLDDIAWGTFEPLGPEAPGRFRLGDNFQAMVWYDTVVGLARRYLRRLTDPRAPPSGTPAP